MSEPVDRQRVKEFAGKLLGIYTGSVLTKLIGVGHETGLFEAAAGGPGTSHEIAERAGLNERYVREWLGAMATSGLFSYDPASQTYSFPPEHAALLTGHSASNFAPMSQMLNHFGTHLKHLIRCFREGGGIPYSAFRPEFTKVMDDTWRRIYDEHLLTGFLGAAPDIPERLMAGIHVADIGCGTGHTINLMGRAYPRSTFVGFDLAEDAIAEAREEARRMELPNVRFEVRDVTTFPEGHTFDVITAFDAIHDQVAPHTVLAAVRRALSPEGIFLMIDFKFSSSVEGNMRNPYAPLYYGISTMHCMTVSLAEGGAGLGTVWGTELARQMLVEAGFTRVDVLDSPRPQNCIYVCRP